MNDKQLWMLVGGNGAGKSTFYERILKPLALPFINADLIAKDVYPQDPEGHSRDAARIAEKMRVDLLAEGRSFCFETVFSHPSKVDFIAQAKAMGYKIFLVLIHVESVELNYARIAQRVIEGGHNVDSKKVASRIPRTLEHVSAAIPLCDQVRVLDNSRLGSPYKPVLTIRQGIRTHHVKPSPLWAISL